MKFRIHKTSDWNVEQGTGVPGTYKEMLHYADGKDYKEGEFINISTLEELMDIIKITESDIVVTDDASWWDGPGIEIYDDYRE